MTLATAILFFALGFTSVDPGVVEPPMPQSDSAGSAPTSAQQAQSSQNAPESTKPSPPKPPSQTPAKKPSTGKKTSQTEKVAPTGTATCDPATTTNGSSAGSTPEPAPQPGSAQEPSTTEPPKNCPSQDPAQKKKIVRQGGITEQSIQLAGGSGDEATKNRSKANRLLKETEDNLNKLAGRQLNPAEQKSAPQILQFVKLTGRQLSSAEQSSVSQIVQFREESEKAANNGDLERAYTLAWKAQVISDDLVNPKK